jgi:hypothetical protein
MRSAVAAFSPEFGHCGLASGSSRLSLTPPKGSRGRQVLREADFHELPAAGLQAQVRWGFLSPVVVRSSRQRGEEDGDQV